MTYQKDYKKIVLITGCSSGIGLDAAVFLATKGIRVYAGVRNLERIGLLDNAAGRDGVGHLLTPVKLDVDHNEEIDQVTRLIFEKERDAADAGAEFILVNNAGFAVIGAAEDITLEAYERQFRTNFFGAVALTKAFLPELRRRGRGKVIQISSTFGRIAAPVVSAYAASKFALEGFSESLRYEVIRHGIYISLVEPGPVISNLIDNINYAEGYESSPYREFYQKYQDLAEMSNLVASQPREISETILRIIESPKPSLRYPIGATAAAETLNRFIPEALVENFYKFI